MSEEITATVTFDLPTMLVGRRWFNRLNPIRRMMRFILITSLVAAALVFVTNVTPEVRGYVVCISVALSVGIALGTLLERFIFASNFKSNPLLGQRVVCKANQSGLQVETPVSASTLSWNAFYKTVGTSDGVLMLQQKLLFYWLPKSSFASEPDYTRFLDLLAAKTKHSNLG